MYRVYNQDDKLVTVATRYEDVQIYLQKSELDPNTYWIEDTEETEYYIQMAKS
jgi:hypothetical protein